MTGRLVLVVGPSGAGKDTLLAGAVAADPRLHWVRRVITRPETAGAEPFEGVSEAEFHRRAARGEFALTWAAHGLHYGVPQSELAPLGAKRTVLLNVSREVLADLQDRFDDVMVINVSLPLPLLAARLAQRGRETPEQIAARLGRVPRAFPKGARVVDLANDGTPAEGIGKLLQAISG